ncbi:MAG TPA: GTPase [Polyangiaceae bacterium]|nr:GTPase [Polyangiaceae bacterium]
MSEIALGPLIKQKVEEAMRDRGHATVLIAGRSGVGKSTLINAVFQGRLAETGHGRPVTQEIREYEKPGMPISLIDTRGLELEKYSETLSQLRTLVSARQKERDPNRHVHCGWVCISEDSRRVGPGETALVDLLEDNDVPVVVVITKARADQGFRAEVQRLLPRAKNVVSVRAIHEVLDEGVELPPKGLPELVDITMTLIPEGQKTAFVAAQQVSLALKQKRARAIVAGAAASAALVGAAPIPFADAALLVPIQISMLAGTSAAFGLELNDAFFATLLSSVTGTLGATLTGRAIVGGLLKLVPGLGSAAGGAIAAATAATVTTTLGESYVQVLTQLAETGKTEAPSAEDVAKALSEAMKKKRG